MSGVRPNVMTFRAAPLLTALTLLAACGDQTTATSEGSSPTDVEGELVVWTTVLEDRTHGPHLCLGGVAESLPPQCGAVPVTNWDWDAVPGEDELSGTTWGDRYVVVGTYADGAFTLTRPVEQADEPPYPGEDDVDFETPCPEPAGGWRPLDPALTTEASMQRVARVANRLPGFADLWLDQSMNPAYGQPIEGLEDELAMNDPALLVVNVRVTSDVDSAEASLREVWGGALCVTEAARSDRELQRIRGELMDVDGFLSIGSARDVVDLGVVHDDGTLQARLDAEYGPGVVRVSSALRPYVER